MTQPAGLEELPGRWPSEQGRDVDSPIRGVDAVACLRTAGAGYRATRPLKNVGHDEPTGPCDRAPEFAGPGLFRALVETSANLMVTETSETLLKHRLADQSERAGGQFLDTSKKPGPGGRRLMNNPRGFRPSGRSLRRAIPSTNDLDADWRITRRFLKNSL